MPLTRVNNKLRCEICDRNHSCSFDKKSNRYFCRRTHNSFDGFKLLSIRAGFGVFSKNGVVGEKYTGEKTSVSQYGKGNVSSSYTKTVKPSLRELVTDIDTVFRALPLKKKHKDVLLDKGLPLGDIESGYFVSVSFGDQVKGCKGIAPGFDSSGTWRMGSGILCPILDIKGYIIGYQVKNDNPLVGKYIWVRSFETSKKEVLRNDSRIDYHGDQILPISLVRGAKSTKTLYLAEGILKPIIIAKRFGVNVVGAAGGQFIQSQKLLRNIITKLQPDEIVWAADSGTCYNPNVIPNLEEVNTWLEATFGKTLKVLDYDQLLVKEDGKDPDEVSELTFRTASKQSWKYVKVELTPDVQLESAYTMVRSILDSPDVFGGSDPLIKNTIARKFEGKLHSPTFNHDWTPGISFKGEDRAELLSMAHNMGYKYVLDASNTGSGKTFWSGKLELEDFSKGDKEPDRLWYLHKQHRDPSTETVELNFFEYPTKNTRLFQHPYKRTPAQKLPVLMRNGEKGAKAVLGNCYRADEQAEFYQAGSSANLCKKCPMKKQCAEGEEPGQYGYLFQVKEALNNTRIRANINGLNPDNIGEDDVVVIDEYTQSVEFTEQITIGLVEWNSQQKLLANEMGSNYSILKPLIDIMNGQVDLGRFGWTYSDFRAHFETGHWSSLIGYANKIGDIQKESNKQAAYAGDPPVLEWIEPLFLALSGLRTDYTFTFQSNSITVYRRKLIGDKLDSFGMVVFMDATSTKSLLSMQLGCQESEILLISQESGDISNVTINQIASIGTPNKARTPKQKKGIKLIRDWAKKKYNGDVGFIDWKMFSEEGDLVHFVDGRGSNAFKDKKAVISFGVANTNLNAAIANFEVLNGLKVGVSSVSDPLMDFQTYYRMLQQAEILQEIGRLRGSRRDEALDFYSVSSTNMAFLKQMGYNYRIVRGYEISEDIMTPKEAIIRAAIKLHKDGAWDKISISKFCKQAGLSRSTLYRFMTTFKNGWKDFRKSVEMSILENPNVIYELIRRKCKGNQRTVLDILTLIRDLESIAVENNLTGTVQDSVVMYTYSPYEQAQKSIAVDDDW